MAQKSLYTKELGQLVASNADGSLETIYHVISTLSGAWGVVRSGRKRPCRVFPTLKEAVTFGKKYAKLKSALELVIHSEKDATVKKTIILNQKNKPVNGVRK